MQMLTKTEFKKELLNKYEISHGLSNDIIDGMISRGFIPSVTNEVGDETYNIDYYIENEDIFDSRLTEYKNTRGYYTDSELKEALVDRDSSFASIPVNAFNDLAKRGLIKKDDFYEVRRNEAYLFASNLIYDIEAIKSAIAELDAQLEAEEADELELLNNGEIIEENTGAQPEKDSSEIKNEDEFEEDEWEYDDYDEQLEKKQKAKKKAQERKKREEALRKEESLKKEAELKAAEKAQAEKVFSETSVPTAPAFVSTEHITEEKPKNTYDETKSEAFKAEKSASSSDYKEKIKQETTEPTVVSSQTGGNEAYSPSKGGSEQKSISLDKETYKTVESSKITNVEEHKYVESSSVPNVNKTTDGQNKATDYSVPKSSDVVKNKSYDNSVNEDKVKRIKEEVERKKEYEEERHKSHESVKTEEKPKLRNDDGTFTFTGTEIGKTEPVASSDNKSNATNNDRTSSPSYSDKTSQRDNPKENTTNQKKVEINYPNVESQPEPTKEKLDTFSYNNKENASREVPTSRDTSVYSENKSGESREAQTKSDLNKSHSYSSDDIFASEKQRYDEIAYEEKENKKATEAKREAEIKSDYQKKETVNKDEHGYTFTGTSVGKIEHDNKSTKESQSIYVDETKAVEGPNRPQQSSRKNSTTNDFIDEESNFSVSSRPHSEPSSKETISPTVATTGKKDSEFVRDTVAKDSPSSPNEAGQQYKINVPLADESHITFETKNDTLSKSMPVEETSKSTRANDQYDNKEGLAESRTASANEIKSTETTNNSQWNSRKIATTDNSIDKESNFSGSSYPYSEPSSKEPTPSTVATADKKDSKFTKDTVADDSNTTLPTNETFQSYKINVPLADGSYMTFEAKNDVLSKSISVEEASRSTHTNDPYDNFNTRMQSAYVSSGIVLSQKAIDELTTSTANHAGANGFTVKIVNTDNLGKTTEKVIYNSNDVSTCLGDISEAYRRGSRVEKLPNSSESQDRNDQKVLFAVGVKNGGEVKDGTYIPPAVPTIHPRILNELLENDVTSVKVNGVNVSTKDLAKVCESNFSVIENNDEYQNRVVAEEIIKKVTQVRYNSSDNRTETISANKIDDSKIRILNDASADVVKKAEKTIVDGTTSQEQAYQKFSVNQIKKNPDFVPSFIKEKYNDNQKAIDRTNIPTDVTEKTIRVAQGIGKKSVLGRAADMNSSHTTNREVIPSPDVFSQFKKGTTTSTRVKEPFSNKLGSATEAVDVKPIAIDFSKPKEVEIYAASVEVSHPELAKELRSISKDINGDIAIVLASQSTNSKLIVDGARLINNPSVYIEGKAENAEIIASAIEKQHPENATKIRELSKQLNGDVADIYRGVNNTTGEYLLKNPERFIKSKASDAEAVARAIEERYPETAKRIRDLSRNLNTADDSGQSILKQFGTKSVNEMSKYSVEQVQELLQNTHVLKGHAKEIEDIAASIEFDRPDIAKQLRQASRAQHGAAAEIYERASFAQRKINRIVPNILPNSETKDNNATIKSSYDTANGPGDIRKSIFVIGTVDGFSKEMIYKKLSAENIRTKTTMMTFTEKDRFGRKHLGLVSINADGTMNITWNANSKRGAVTLKGYAPDIKGYDDTALKGELAKKSRLAQAGIRNRKLNEVRFNTSTNAQFYLDPAWVKSTRKANRGIQGKKVNNVDALSADLMKDANRIYKLYASGRLDAEMEIVYDKYGFAGDGTVVKGLRATERIKEQRKHALGKVASNIMWHIMPAQELNSTYLGSGYKYLLGRGSAIWTLSNIGAALNAKDELRALNKETLLDMGPSEIKLANSDRLFDFHSAKDRRALNKQIKTLSQNEFKVDITRFTNKSLKEALVKGELQGRTLTESEKDLFRAMLQLRGLSEGTLSTLTAMQYLNGIGVNPFSRLSKNSQSLLEKAGFGGRDIASLDKYEITQIFNYFDTNKITVPAELDSLLYRAETLNFANLDTKEGIQALLSEISIAGQNIKINDALGQAVNIAELSNKQIELLLKKLPQDSEMRNLLSQTLKLRTLLEKKSKLSAAIGKLKDMSGFMLRKAVFKLRGQALGDGLYATYNAYRTVNMSIKIVQTLRVMKATNKAALRQFLENGRLGSLRNKLANTRYFKRKFARMDAKEAKMLKRAQKKAHKQQLRKSNHRKRVNKVKGKVSKRIPKKIKRVPKGLRRFGNGFKRFNKGISKTLGVVLKPFKAITGFINKVKQKIMEKLIVPIIKYGVIAIGVLVLLQVVLGFASAGLEGVYSIIHFKDNTVSTEDVNGENSLTTEESLTNNSVELCINLDSAFKYYIEKYYEEPTIIKAVKDSIKEENEDELKSFYDPKEDEYLHLKRLGTTLNKIQTGIYYSYYNGDAKEIGFKSNAKDIAAMANAWIGEDFHAKGLYKSYVEKLWNYSHMVAYAPRNVSDTSSYATARDSIDDKETYGDNRYVYSCSSNKESSECYKNAYDYKCNNSGANVYDSSKKVRMDIKNGADKTAPTDKTGTTSGTVIKTLKDKNGISYLTKSYPVTNGIAEYNKDGCSNDILTYHKGGGNNVSAEVVNSSKGGYNTTKNLPAKSSNRLQNQTITFWSNATKPTGCTHWNKINYAVKVSGTIVERTAYYCSGCATAHTYKDAEGKDKTYTSSNIAHDETIHIVPTIKDIHKGKKATIIGGYTWYAKDSLSGDCSEKKYFTHTLGSSHNGCNNYETIETTNSKTVKCEGTCWLNPQNGKSYYYATKVFSKNTIWSKVRTANGIERKLLYPVNSLKIEGTVKAPKGNSMKWPPVSKTMDTSPAILSNLGTLTYQATGQSANISYTGPVTVGKTQYIYDIRINGNVILDANSDRKITSNDQVKITYYPNKCDGTPADKHKSDYKVTTYNCLGHERCTGYLKDNAQDININYGKNYCPGHTLMHYCTGHVDLNVAVVTLFLGDKNDLAYLGVPREVDTSQVKVTNLVDSLTGNEMSHTLDIQTPKENTTYLYDNAFSDPKFDRFDYEKFPLPDMSIWTNFTVELHGDSVTDDGNFGNPLDTLRWTPDFVNDKVDESYSGKKTLNDVISALYSTFSTHGIWEDRNDGATGSLSWTAISVDAFNVKGDYSKFGKHHYFDGWFTYDSSGKIEWAGDIGHQPPKDTGAYARAVESTKEDWYEAYKIAFPGAYNSRPSDKEIERMEQNLIKFYPSSDKSKIPAAKTLIQRIGEPYDGSGIKFAVEEYQKFYKAAHGTKDNFLDNAYNSSRAFSSSYTYQAKAFRRTLGVKSLAEKGHVESIIKNLSTGDLIGAGDEVYVVLYTDTTSAGGIGIDEGHVIVATVNGSESSAGNDQIHLFSFTTEYILKKSELFWVYKCS